MNRLVFLASRQPVIVGSLLLFAGLVLLRAAAPDAFVPVVALGMMAAPVVNWRAWWRLRAKRMDRAARHALTGKEPPIESLRVATNNALLFAIGATVTAGLAVFVALRALEPLLLEWFGITIGAADREVFLLLLSYPPLLAVGPALAWLDLVRKLERGEVAAVDVQA